LETGCSFVFLTNNFHIAPDVVAEIYKNRWSIEIFFKWIKQNLRVRGFYSRNPNGVRCQVMSALCAYLLVAIAKKELRLSGSMHQILQIVSISAFDKVPLNEMFINLDTTNSHINTQMVLAINES
jgi:IS4 transposase